jgi:threonine aldolase
MSLTDAERKLLRKRCTTHVSGFRRETPAEEFRALAEWCEANGVEHDHYGNGEIVVDFEKKIATLLGKPAAVFMPSGIMAQLSAVQIWCERAGVDRFGFHPTSHLLHHEDEAYAALMRLHAVPIGDRLRPMTASDLDAIKQKLACAIVELPIRRAGGQLPTWDELEALKESADRRSMPLHMDGARLWESAAFYDRPHAAICEGFASVYVSVYKGVGAFAGALLAGDADFVDEARLWRRRMGGTLYHLSPLVAPAAMRFDERIALMPKLFERTKRLAEALSTIEGLRVNPAVPQASMLHLLVDAPADAVLDARDRLAERTGTWLLDHASAVDVPGWCSSELNVGELLLSLDDTTLMPLYAELVTLAHHPS